MRPKNDFAALIGSRICHDLISPIGAIDNGLELLEMSIPSMGPEMELIAASVHHASARIRFFRIAFGSAGTQQVGKSEVTSILRDMFAEGRFDVIWKPEEGIPKTLIRLTFLALLCMESGMPFGGRIEIAHEDGKMLLTGHADKFKIDPSLWAILTGSPSLTDSPSDQPLIPAHVQFGLLHETATTEQRSLEVSTDNDLIVIKV